MIRFIAGVLTPFLILGGWLGWSVGRFGVLRWSEIAALAITLLVIPAVSACLAVALSALPSSAREPSEPA